MADETSVPSSAQAKRTIKIKPLTFRRPSEVPNGNPAGTSILPNPASTQANPAAVIPQAPPPVETVQNVGAATVKNLAQKTLKLAPPTRTGTQRPTPAPSAAPASVPPRTAAPVPAPDAGRTQLVSPIPQSSDAAAASGGAIPPAFQNISQDARNITPEASTLNLSSEDQIIASKATVRDIARQTIKIAPPTRTGAQRPSPVPSVSPAPPPTLDSAQKAGPITLQESSICAPSAARTQAVPSPSAARTQAVPSPSAAIPDAKKPTIRLKPMTVSEAVPEPTPQEIPPQKENVPELELPPVDQAVKTEVSAAALPKPENESATAEPEAEKTEEAGSESLAKPPKPPVPDIDDLGTMEDTEADEKASSSEPGTVFMIFSLVSLLVLLLSAYVLLAQFGSMWLTNFPVLPLPGLK